MLVPFTTTDNTEVWVNPDKVLWVEKTMVRSVTIIVFSDATSLSVKATTDDVTDRLLDVAGAEEVPIGGKR